MPAEVQMPGRPVLLVEDNEEDLVLALRGLRGRLSNEVIVARDGQQALDYLLPSEGAWSAHRVPIAMILDLGLPRLDGRQLLRRIATEPRCQGMAVVVTTASGDPEDRIDSYMMGALAYLTKPVDFEKLVHALRRPGYVWQLDREEDVKAHPVT
jgi:CheY-like chemotaxis protein